MIAAAPAPLVSATIPSPDPRVGLKAGYWDAAETQWNLRRVSTTPPHERNNGQTHSDLAFTGKYVIQGNYNGFQIFDMSNAAKPVVVSTFFCPASQNDVSVYKDLLFMSSEATNSRADCTFGNIPEPVSKDRVRGIRIFDISSVGQPKLVKSVQTCRGSHTHTVVEQPGDKDNIYIYVSGSSGVRPADELPGCSDGTMEANPDTARFRIEVIKVPLSAPQNAAIVSSPRIFTGLAAPPTRGGGAGAAGAAGDPARAGGAGAAGAASTAAAGATPPPVVAGAPAPGGRGGGGPRTGPNQCHDITVYPAAGLAGGACNGLGLLLDIREAAHPIRIDFAADANMSLWHSATFSNDGTKVLFSDEWGGGSSPRCRETDNKEFGANAIFTIEKNKMVFKSYYKMPAAQTDFENCVAHNGSMIPIPGREVMVQAWYQGGISVFDWTDPAKAFEVAFHDRGPLDGTRLVSGGSWSVYWYNGYLVSSEIKRGLDIFELVASPLISQNEIDAANTVKYDFLNAQGQPKMVWPPSFALARAFVDQLERSKGLSAARVTAVRAALSAAERASGGQRRTALNALATSLNADVAGSSDQAKVRMLVSAVTDLGR